MLGLELFDHREVYMVSGVLTPLLWAFVPSYLTRQALPLLSSNFPSLFPPSPQGSPLFIRNYRICFTLIVGGYLVWSFASSGGRGAQDDWYSLLGVTKGAEDEQLKKAFRTLSRTYHPDRTGGQTESHFILIRQAYEVLSDPVKRYAYDRFGPDSVDWKTCKTVKDYMYAGMMRSVGFYLFSGGAMILLTILGKAREGSYWSKLLFAILLLLELHLVLSPTPSRSTSSWILGKPQFAQVELAHRIWASLSVAITQLAGVWAPQQVSEEVAWRHVGRIVKELEAEAVTQFQGDLVPILAKSGQPNLVQATLRQRMEQILVDRTVSSHPIVRDQWKEALNALMAQSNPRPRTAPSELDLDLACRIPLPPSPRLYPHR